MIKVSPMLALVKANRIKAGLLALAALVLGLWFFGVVAGIRHLFENRQVQQLEQKATDAETKAGAQVKQADQLATERAAEDLNRERTITPEIARTSRTVTETRERARKAQANYEKTLTQPDLVIDPDTAALHRRNCTDLAELYPGEQHPACDR